MRPPNLSPDNLPDTAFTCEDKVTGGYYADVEADCQLFHVCVQVSEYEVSSISIMMAIILPVNVIAIEGQGSLTSLKSMNNLFL